MHNIEVSLILAAAIGLTLADIIGLSVRSYLPNVTLALLALVAVTLTRIRFLLETAGPKLSQNMSWTDSIEEIGQRIKRSKEICFWGAGLTDHIPMLREALQNGLTNGLRAQVLLIKPTSAAVNMLAFRAVVPPDEPNPEPKSYSYKAHLNRRSIELDHLVKNSIHILYGLEKVRKGGLELRTVDYLGPYLLYLFDPDMWSGEALIRIASQGGKTQDRPTFHILRREEPELFDYFKSQYELAWRAAGAAERTGWNASSLPTDMR